MQLPLCPLLLQPQFHPLSKLPHLPALPGSKRHHLPGPLRATLSTQKGLRGYSECNFCSLHLWITSLFQTLAHETQISSSLSYDVDFKHRCQGKGTVPDNVPGKSNFWRTLMEYILNTAYLLGLLEGSSEVAQKLPVLNAINKQQIHAPQLSDTIN